MPAPPRSTPQSRYRTAAATLQRDTTLDALRELLRERNWRGVTMNDVASAAGLSRQTIYNEFGSRRGLAQGYAMRLTDAFVSVVDAALYQHVDDVEAALRQGFSTFFAVSVVDPLVMSLHGPDAPDDLLRLITTDSDVLIDRAGEHMSGTLQTCWVGAPKHQADILSRAIVRLALSYIPKPPSDPDSTADDLSQLLSPFVATLTSG